MSNRRRIRQSPTGGRRPAPRRAPVAEELDSSDWTPGPGADPEDDLGDLIDAVFDEQHDVQNLFDAECGMGLLLGLAGSAGLDEDKWHAAVLSRLEATGTAKAAGLIATMAVLSEGPGKEAALAALDRTGAAGITPPAWAAAVAEPVTTVRCLSLDDGDGDVWGLAAEFSHAGGEHAFVLVIEPDDCGAAADLLLLEPDRIPHVLRVMVKEAAQQRHKLTEVRLDPAEFRWRAEAAMDARAVHDAGDLGGSYGELEEALDDNGPSYHTLAAVFRARLRTLPEPGKAKPPHHGRTSLFPGLLDGPDSLLTAVGDRLRGYPLTSRAAPELSLPARRRAARGAAPILQLRVDIRGARPPIWRRLEVPADVTLARLHQVLQAAFGWNGSHLYVFETGFGPFGRPNDDLGFHSDSKVTLEQVVAPTQGAKITYTYDFGDDWEHIIAVERVLPRHGGTYYPRCTGGRRARPPEDCGGMYGYEELLAVLADPDHEEHDALLEWLCLDSADQFDPAAFDLDLVNRALSARSG